MPYGIRWMSFWTSFSSNLRPIKRLTAYSVFCGLVTACRLAGAPTRISPSAMYATMDGVVRAPSAFSIILTLLPSITATQLLVVPRSIPMIFPIAHSRQFVLLKLGCPLVGDAHGDFKVLGFRLPRRHHDQCRA